MTFFRIYIVKSKIHIYYLLIKLMSSLYLFYIKCDVILFFIK